MYTEQNPQKAILPRQRVMTSRTIGATVPIALSGQTKKEPQVRCELKALMKMAATYSPTGVQYHRRDCA